jgi:hypothetical protein
VGDAMWEIQNFDLENKVIKGQLVPFQGESLEMYERMITGENKRVPFSQSNYVYQIHLYADSFMKDDNTITLQESDVTRLDIFDINQAVRIVSILGTTLLVTVGGIGLLLFIACACPHVYVYDGETYHVDNSLFTGAVAPQLERDDYKLMPDYFASSDQYQFYVKNDEDEKQFTNLLELMVVEHEKGTEVYPDQRGNINLVSNPIMPKSLTDDGNKDLTELVGFHDGRAFVFNNSTAEDFSNVYATFDLPENKKDAKLILQAKNTEWSGYVYNEFTKLFGSYYDNWVKKNQRKKSREEMIADQKKHGLPLVISVKSGDDWVDIETIDLMGAISYNGLAVNIPQEFLSNNELEVRVRSGFMFWKLDYLAIDFTPNERYQVQNLKPAIAKGGDGRDFGNELNADDDLYMDHPVIGDSTYVEFQGLSNNANKARTIILHSKGYYLSLTKHDSKMERKELAKFKADGELSRYSQELYQEQFGDMSVIFE